MGPRSIDRGNMQRLVKGFMDPTGLQWGRDRSIAEILILLLPLAARRGCFNGAAIDRSRKCVTASAVPAAAPCFNGAAIDRSRKYHAWIITREEAGSGFNGAAIDRSRKWWLDFPINGRYLTLPWGRDRSIAGMPC